MIYHSGTAYRGVHARGQGQLLGVLVGRQVSEQHAFLPHGLFLGEIRLMVDDACATIDVPLFRLDILLKLLNHAAPQRNIAENLFILPLMPLMSFLFYAKISTE